MNEEDQRAELEAVLASTLFVRAPELSKILKYVCERHFSNPADTIKEYSIAVEALGRGSNFRPEEDSIVRVQAARLRKQLKRYYETDGVAHALQIRISLTGYKPEFVYARTPEGRAAEAAYEQNWNGRSAGGPDDSLSLETRQAPGILGESDPAIISESGTAFDQPRASRSRSSRKKLSLVLALVATAAILAVVGATDMYRSRTTSTTIPSALSAPPNAIPGTNIRVGFTGPTFLDARGSTWLGDRYFTGGEVFSQTSNQIRRTFDQSLYQTGRRGNFSYAIPLRPGVYELHLHFAEVYFGQAIGADTQRLFDVSINGVPVMPGFDIAKDAGGVYIADEKIFKDVSPGSDGFLRLDFSSRRGQALLNGIEVRPGIRGKMLPVRILCSSHSRLDRNGWLWQADQYFSGGRIAELAESIRDAGFGDFSSYRTGNFDYAIPVAEGSYRIRLLFAEPVIGRERPAEGTGLRLFDVYCNGRALAGRLDVFREAGGPYRVVEKTFSRLQPDAQGKILLSFVPVRSYAVLLAIEVLDENW
jgi:hypothetical protein